MKEKDEQETQTILRFLKLPLDLFSTHSETSKRVAKLRATYPQPEGTEALDLQAWNILRTACEKLTVEEP